MGTRRETPSLVGFFHLPSDDYRNVGDARAAGVEAQCAKSPQERLPVSLLGFNKVKKIGIFLGAFFVTKLLI
jgi:hypothetical protein